MPADHLKSFLELDGLAVSSSVGSLPFELGLGSALKFMFIFWKLMLIVYMLFVGINCSFRLESVSLKYSLLPKNPFPAHAGAEQPVQQR